MVIFSYPLFSQTKCQGTLGKPLINISFGAGANPGQPVTAATSTYQYTAADCPKDGFYTIRNKTEDCFYGDWHSVTKDHTGNENGYFLLVNASFTSNDFYLDTIQNLCSKTTYQFGAWILNMMKPGKCGNGGLRPDVTFSVEKTDGTVLQSFTTNEIDVTGTPQWKQYAFYFSTEETSVVLRMKTNAIGGCGGDFALDDITLQPCNPDVKATIDNSILQSIAYHCKSKDTSFSFSSNFGMYINPAYVWETSTTNGASWTPIPNANKNALTQVLPSTQDEVVYLYRLMVAEVDNMNIPQCIAYSNVDTIRSVPEPVPVFSSNAPVCEGSTLQLTAAGGSQYNWMGPNGYMASGNPLSYNNIPLKDSGQYMVKVISPYGCFAFDSLQVTIHPKPKAFAGIDTSFCEGKATQLQGNGDGTYLWSPAKGLSSVTVSNPYAWPVDTTMYTLKVTNKFGCTDTASIAINIIKKPRVNAGSDKKIMQGSFVRLDGNISGSDIDYYWSPNSSLSDPNSLQPMVNPADNTVFVINAVSACGSAKDEVAVTVLKKVEVPNVFSPNSDGINDTWIIKNLQAYNTAEVFVFDRYGQKIYASRGYNLPWNGTYNGNSLPAGTYYYVIDIKTDNIKLQGSVMIIR